eukprot:4868845-Prymnesium_polylepis.1
MWCGRLWARDLAVSLASRRLLAGWPCGASGHLPLVGGLRAVEPDVGRFELRQQPLENVEHLPKKGERRGEEAG